MKKMKKFVALILALLLCMQLLPASSSLAVNSLFELQVREVFGYENHLYLVTKNDTPIRTEPNARGEQIVTLAKHTPIMGLGLFTNAKGRYWTAVMVDGRLGWIYNGNLKEHVTHDYVSLESYGYGDYELCRECGKIHYLGNYNENGGIELDFSTNDQVHLALAACSFAPGVGNVCDLGDGFLSLLEEDYFGFMLSLVAAIPVLGYAVDVVKGGRTAMKVIDTADEVSVMTRRVLKSGEVIEVYSENNRNLVKVNMDTLFRTTGDTRFEKKEGWAAHHIVEFSDKSKDAENSRKLMEQFGINLNSAANGVYLCSNPAICMDAGGALHTGRHTASYSEMVYQRLKNAADAAANMGEAAQHDALIDELDSIARDLMNNAEQLQKAA